MPPNCVIYKYEMAVKAAATGDGMVVVVVVGVAAADEHDTFPIVRSARTGRCGEERSPTAVNRRDNEGPEPPCDSQVKQAGSVNSFHRI